MHRLSFIALGILLSGCAGLSPYSQMTKLDLQLDADQQLNPDIQGRPSPVVVRLLELKAPAAFNNADFFSLYQRPREILAPDVVSHEELEIRPGEQRLLKLALQPGSRYVGVIAAYRDMPQASWRVVIPVEETQITQTTLQLGERDLHLVATHED